MSQTTNGIRKILSSPWVYEIFQGIMGAKTGRKFFVDKFVKPFDDANLLDIGCGPGDILEYLPSISYWGFDISDSYISRAKTKWGHKGNFICKELSSNDLKTLPKFDIVIAVGVLHHMDNTTAQNVANLAWEALKPGGRFVTIDPCYKDNQNYIARFIISRDRGLGVRTQSGYESLVSSVFFKVRSEVHDKSWIPYTHCYMVCTK